MRGKIREGEVKIKAIRNRKYLDWLRDEECPVSGVTPCEPAHTFKSTGGGGTGHRSSDDCALPLSNLEHRKQSGMSELKYWRDVLVSKPVLRRTMMICYTVIHNDRDLDDHLWLNDIKEHDWLVKRLVQAFANVYYFNRYMESLK